MADESAWDALKRELDQALQEVAEEESLDLAPANSDLVSPPEQECRLLPMWKQMHNTRRWCRGTPFAQCTHCNPDLKEKP